MLIENAIELIKANLECLQRGEKAPQITIGFFTAKQFEDINLYRQANQLPPLLSNEILYVGRHHYQSRVVRDGYQIEDLLLQIQSALTDLSEIVITKKGSTLVNKTLRDDGYGNQVEDTAVFEFTAKKPKSELFCVIPRFDNNKPQNNKAPK